VTHPVFPRFRIAFQDAFHSLIKPRPVLRQEEVAVALSNDFLRPVAEKRLDNRADKGDSTVDINGKDHVVDVLYQVTISLLTFPQSLFHHLTVSELIPVAAVFIKQPRPFEHPVHHMEELPHVGDGQGHKVPRPHLDGIPTFFDGADVGDDNHGGPRGLLSQGMDQFKTADSLHLQVSQDHRRFFLPKNRQSTNAVPGLQDF
jgi:hypothetical protein